MVGIYDWNRTLQSSRLKHVEPIFRDTYCIKPHDTPYDICEQTIKIEHNFCMQLKEYF